MFLHLINRSTAASVGLKTFFTGAPCKRGHVALRRVCSSVCVQCQIEFDRKKWLEKREILAPRNRARHYENRDARLLARRVAWSKDADRLKAKRAKWGRDNPGVVRHINSLRKKQIKRATPPWAEKEKIKAVYLEAQALSVKTGVLHHVDHVIPLQGETVCGLHVHRNLAALPWRDNLTKKNKFSGS